MTNVLQDKNKTRSKTFMKQKLVLNQSPKW